MNLKKIGKRAKSVLAFVLTINLFFGGWVKYDFSVLAANNPVVFDIVWNIKNYVFDGSTDYFPTAIVNGIAVEKRNEAVEITNGITVTLTTAADNAVTPGKYTATLTLNDNSGNYKLADGKAICEYNVEKKNLSDADVNVTLSRETAVANGTNQAPTVVVTVGDKTLAADKDYTVTMDAEMITVGTYDIKVSGMGNYEGEVTKQFVIEFANETDTKAPEITLDETNLSGNDKYLDTKEKVYWFSDNKVNLPFTVADELGDMPNEILSTYKVVYSTAADFANATEAAVTDNAGIAAIEIAEADKAVTYYFKAVDFAGNEGVVQTIQLGHDNSPAKITDLELTQLNGDEWINAAEFNGESKAAFSVTIDEAQSGVKSIEYSADGGKTYAEATYTETDGVFTFVTNEAYPDGDTYKWQVKVTNNVNVSSEEKVAETLGKIDVTAPETEAYIQFFADTVGSNDISEGVGKEDNKGGWASDILSMAGNAWNKIWGKTTVSFEVYVKDETSGIAGPEAVVMTYTKSGSENAETITLEAVTGVQAFDAEDIAKSDELKNSGYSIFKGSIQIKEDEVVTLSASDFRIASIIDAAGNVTRDLVLNSAEDGDIIYIDAETPKLVSVFYTDASGNTITPEIADEKRDFYKETVYAAFRVKERFFGEDGAYPVIVLKKTYIEENGTLTAEKPETITTSKDDWAYVSGSEYTYTYKLTDNTIEGLKLDLQSKKEAEYDFSISYTDPSGNVLTASNGVSGVHAGVYTSREVVIDNLAPKITSYEVVRTTNCDIPSRFMEGNAEVRKNDAEAEDLTVTFSIDDNAVYYELSKANLAVNVYMDESVTPTLTLGHDDLTPNAVGRNYTYSFSYAGKKTTENEFHVEIVYSDQAGNELINSDENLTKVSEGKYKSGQYIIDHVAPELTVKYISAPARNVKNGEDSGQKRPEAGYTAYYKDDIKVKFSITEKYAHINEDTFEHFEIIFTKDGSAMTEDVPEIKWTHMGSLHTGEFTIKADKYHNADGDYTFEISYNDCAMNLMNADDKSNESASTNVYRSPKLVLDTTAPIVNTRYVNGDTEVDPVRPTINGRDYFNTADSVFEIEVIDRNIRDRELKVYLTDMEAHGYNTEVVTESDDEAGERKTIEGTAMHNYIEKMSETAVQCVAGNITAEENTKVYNLPLTTDANYDIPVNFKDLAGNSAIVNGEKATFTELVTVDTKVPEFELTYNTEDYANYLEFGYWLKKSKIVITLTAKDEVSGVEWIQFTVTDENDKVTQRNRLHAQPAGSRQWTVEVPIDKVDDFKGTVCAKVLDFSTNSIDETRGQIVESAGKHSATGKAEIETITSPSRTVGGVAYYNTDVKFKLVLEDTYSGLASWIYKAGRHPEQKMDYKSHLAGADQLDKASEEEITYNYTEVVTIDSTLNNENDVLVTASYIDNVGYDDMEVQEEYNIDITKPIITVEYDLNNPANGKYYNEVRTATVKIRERNFDAADVEFLITSTDGPKPQISSWSHSGSGDDTVHTCTVTFNQDSDYTFTLKFMDMAGNVAEYDRVDEFTIDLTDPVATITYDNNDYLNEYYYDASRTATIDILEHNFDPTAIEIMITADGATAGVPRISSWAQNGDHNIATITYSADAEYTFDIAGADLALNELEDYTPDHFVIDQTAPELEIFDIEHMSANNGVVRPGIRYFDTNYDKDGTVILMTGYINGIVEMTGDRKLEANGLELKLNDFAYVQEMDDIYTMEAVVYDLAGNSSEAAVMFSVNRFGSVYTFDEATDALIGENGSYYTKEAQDLVITETNVDTLEFQEITMNMNGKLTTLKEGVDYTVSGTGSDVTWKQYTYTIKASNFTEEGKYILTIYSEDRATNVSDNNTKGKKVEFVIDKTNPSVLISGVETDGQYRTNVQNMTIDVDDNVLLSTLKVIIDGVETIFDGKQIAEADGKIVVGVNAKNYAQNIEVTLIDAAGNVMSEQITNVRVNANAFVLFCLNKPLFFGTLGGSAALAIILFLHKILRISLFHSSSS